MDDLTRFCCQKPDCALYGQRNAGNLSVCGLYGRHNSIRLLYCKACKYRFSARKGTPLFQTHLPEQKARSVLQHLSEGCGVPQTGRLVDVHPNSVVRLAKKAGQHARDAQDELVAFSPSDPRGPVRRDVVVRGQEAKEWRSPQPGRRPQGGLVGPRRYDPQHKLVLALVPGRGLPRASKKSSARSRTAIGTAFSQPVVVPQETAGPGRRPLLPQRCLDPGVTSATVRKKRQNNGVVAVDRTVVPGTQEAVDRVLKGSVCSRTINTSFVERQHATAWGQNARPSRRTYRFSKDWEVHESMSYFTRYRYNFCWPVRTLRARGADGRWQQRAPAMSAGLSDHIWSMEEWLSFPVIQRI